jgi:hypothetical protein
MALSSYITANTGVSGVLYKVVSNISSKDDHELLEEL